MRFVENPYAGQGPVVIDVGGDVGALLVRMPASLEGVEIEIRPHELNAQPASDTHAEPNALGSHSHSGGASSHTHLVHVEVLPRPTSGGFVHCAVFPELVEGEYELSERPFGQVRLRVSITGGQVTDATWPIPG